MHCRRRVNRWQMVFHDLQGAAFSYFPLRCPSECFPFQRAKEILSLSVIATNAAASSSARVLGTVTQQNKILASCLQVKLSKNVRAHWGLLKERLKKVCPLGGASIAPWNTQTVSYEFGEPFLLSVSSYDRSGVLHGETLHAFHCLLRRLCRLDADSLSAAPPDFLATDQASMSDDATSCMRGLGNVHVRFHGERPISVHMLCLQLSIDALESLTILPCGITRILRCSWLSALCCRPYEHSVGGRCRCVQGTHHHRPRW